MPHRSDSDTALIRRTRDARGGIPALRSPDVALYLPPWHLAPDALDQVARHAAALPAGSIACILSSPRSAAELLASRPGSLRFQLWIAAKLAPGAAFADPGQLPENHAALLVLSRYDAPLRHAKTRLAYTYCPACGKSTKDYGGKKHTYHEYGTLLSDVWRDVAIDPNGDITPVTDRLRDLFGVAPHHTLHVIDLRKVRALRPVRRPATLPAASEATHSFAARPRPQADLFNTDCLSTLKRLPTDSIDYVFADPPYNVAKTYDTWDDGMEIADYFRWCDARLDELARVLKPGRSLTVINIPLYAARHFAHLSKSMLFQSWIAWDGLSLPVRLIMPAHYGIVTFSKGRPRPLPGLANTPPIGTREGEALRPAPEWFCLRAPCVAKHARARALAAPPLTDLWHDIHRLKHNSRRADHPCQLPPALMDRLIALFTNPGETVLDPFNGAGTTTLCAARLKRSAIGIELSPEYHAIARQRHADLASGLDPFAKHAATPAVKNSRVERLPRRRHAVPKKTLQLEVRAIARRLGRLPTRDEVAAMSEHPIRLFDECFVSWGEVCASARHAGMSELRR